MRWWRKNYLQLYVYDTIVTKLNILTVNLKTQKSKF